MQLYAGSDLHSINTYIGIMDEEFFTVAGKTDCVIVTGDTLSGGVEVSNIYGGQGAIDTDMPRCLTIDAAVLQSGVESLEITPI